MASLGPTVLHAKKKEFSLRAGNPIIPTMSRIGLLRTQAKRIITDPFVNEEDLRSRPLTLTCQRDTHMLS